MSAALLDWLRGATPEQIAGRIEAAENDAFLWHIAMAGSGEKGRELHESCEKIAGLLRKGGYVWPPLEPTS